MSSILRIEASSKGFPFEHRRLKTKRQRISLMIARFRQQA